LKGEAVSVSRGETDKLTLKLDELRKAANEGSLARFLDDQDIPTCVVSKFLASEVAVRSLENVLQPIWFGGNIEEKDGSNETPIMLASRYGPPAVVNALLKAGATTHGRSNVGFSSLHLAARYNSHKVVSLLLEAKSEVNAKNNDGWTPLHFAAAYNSHKAVSLLLDAKSEVNAKENKRWTALHFAAKYSSLKVVSLLLDAKSELNCENNYGSTPLLYAARYGNANMVAELLKFRADIHKKNKSGYDVYSFAKFNRKDSKNVLAVLRGTTDL
jgi:ankyrin repeat protein